MKPLSLIIITGHSCTGKTTLGKHISKQLELPFIYKDGFKEALFNSFQVNDIKTSAQLGKACFDLMHYTTESLLQSKISHILEAPFNPEYENKRFQYLVKEYDLLPIQILLKADPEVLYQRYVKRSESKERHPGHMDMLRIDKNEVNGADCFKKEIMPLEINGKVIKINTTDYNKVDLNHIINEIKSINN